MIEKKTNNEAMNGKIGEEEQREATLGRAPIRIESRGKEGMSHRER